jgi:hypothetical protein
MFARLFISSPFFRISCKKCARHEQRTRATHEQRKRQGRARAIYANCFANVDAFTEVCTETKGTTLLIEQAGRYINGGSLDRAHRSTRSCSDIGGMAAATAVLFPLVSTPPLMLLIMRITNSPAIMGIGDQRRGVERARMDDHCSDFRRDSRPGRDLGDVTWKTPAEHL